MHAPDLFDLFAKILGPALGAALGVLVQRWLPHAQAAPLSAGDAPPASSAAEPLPAPPCAPGKSKKRRGRR